MVTRITITIEIDGNNVAITQPITTQSPLVAPEQISQPTKLTNTLKDLKIHCYKYNKKAGFKESGSCFYCNIRHGCHLRDYVYDKDGILQDTGPIKQGPMIKRTPPVEEIIIPLVD
jgi:hypothetical protein